MKIKRFHQLNEVKTSDKTCNICGSPLYRTDSGGSSVTLQCSSDDAKFWNFHRGSEEQKKAHQHFMKSSVTISEDEWQSLSKI